MHTSAKSAIPARVPRKQIPNGVPSCIGDHNWPLSSSSYNGPHSHSRKLRVSLSVIRWIPRSSPLEDFQNRGSRNHSREARDESNVRSEMQELRPKGRCRESSSAAPAARNPPTCQPRRMGRCGAGRVLPGAALGWAGQGTNRGSACTSQTSPTASIPAGARPASRS